MTNYRRMSDEEFPSSARTANGRDVAAHHREAVRRGLTSDTPAPGKTTVPTTYRRVEAVTRMLQDEGHMTPMATRQILAVLRAELAMSSDPDAR